MKTIKATLTIATLVLASVCATAQTSFVKIRLAENSNDLAQVHSPLIIAFDANGNDSLQYPDAGNQSNFGQYNAQMFPFTHSSDSFVISNYDARPELTTYTSIPFGILSKDTGTVKIIASLATNDPNVPVAGFVWIENTVSGERYSLLDTVKLDISGNINCDANYILHIGPTINNAVANETCYGMNDGSLLVQGPNYAGFTHELTFNGTPLYSSVVTGIDTLVNGLAPGNYVSVVRINGIPVDSSDITVSAASLLLADFASDYNQILEGGTVNFTDNCTGALVYTWDFGDGDSSAVAGNESHQYLTAGNYVVTLTVSDANGCTASNFDNIQVDAPPMANGNSQFSGGHGSFNAAGGNTPTPADPVDLRNRTTITLNNARVIVNLGEVTSSSVTVVAANGTVIANEFQNNSLAEYALPATGLYIVYVTSADGTVTTASVLAQ